MIHPMSLKDLPAVLALYLKTFPAVDDADFATAWQHRHESSAVYFSDIEPRTLVGFGLVAPSKEYCTKLWFITVDPAHRGGGTGSRLLNAIMESCDTLALCPVNETPIIEWYKRHGFVISRTMPFIHHDIPVHTMVWNRTTCLPRTVSEASTEVSTPVSCTSYGSELDADEAFVLLTEI